MGVLGRIGGYVLEENFLETRWIKGVGIGKL
jgi:hypothetical protein